MTVYEKHGYRNRKDYLKSLAEDFGLPKSLVFSVAAMLGETEDFDGLISCLEDAGDFGLF
jgi:hypothetical protein